jgi:hypothetical protein
VTADEWLREASAPEDLVLAKSALRAVLDLHKPCDDSELETGDQHWCVACDQGWDGWNFDLIKWPCPTMRAIDKALGVSDG